MRGLAITLRTDISVLSTMGHPDKREDIARTIDAIRSALKVHGHVAETEEMKG